MNTCPRCNGSMLPDVDGLACIACGHVVYRDTPLDIPESRGTKYRTPKGESSPGIKTPVARSWAVNKAVMGVRFG